MQGQTLRQASLRSWKYLPEVKRQPIRALLPSDRKDIEVGPGESLEAAEEHRKEDTLDFFKPFLPADFMINQGRSFKPAEKQMKGWRLSSY